MHCNPMSFVTQAPQQWCSTRRPVAHQPQTEFHRFYLKVVVAGTVLAVVLMVQETIGLALAAIRTAAATGAVVNGLSRALALATAAAFIATHLWTAPLPLA